MGGDVGVANSKHGGHFLNLILLKILNLIFSLFTLSIIFKFCAPKILHLPDNFAPGSKWSPPAPRAMSLVGSAVHVSVRCPQSLVQLYLLDLLLPVTMVAISVFAMSVFHLNSYSRLIMF